MIKMPISMRLVRQKNMKEPQTITVCFRNKVKLCVLTGKDIHKICWVGGIVALFIHSSNWPNISNRVSEWYMDFHFQCMLLAFITNPYPFIIRKILVFPLYKTNKQNHLRLSLSILSFVTLSSACMLGSVMHLLIFSYGFSMNDLQ